MNNTTELDFSTDVLEKLLFRQMLTDKIYMNILSTKFDKRWIKTEHLGKVMQLCIIFFKKYNFIPDIKIVKALVKKYAESNKGANLTELNAVIDGSWNLNLEIPREILSNNLKNFIRKQALYTTIIDNVDELEKNSENVLDNCIAGFDAINKLTFQDQDLGMNYFSQPDMDKHIAFLTKSDARIPFCWPAMDTYTYGGSYKDGRMLGAFMGQPGLGKSAFLSNLTVNFLKQNKKVVVISLEMSQDVYAQRFDAHISGHNINKLKDEVEEAFSKIKGFAQEHPDAALYIKEYPPKSIRSIDIEMYLENLILNGFKFDAVIVDYLNLVLPNKSADNMYRDVLTVSENLRALSYKFSCPFWTATQTNTEGINNENVDMQNVSESRGIVHTLDFLGALFQTPDDREEGIINCKLLKNRLGGVIYKTVSFKLDPENLVLSDITYDTDREDLNFTPEADNILRNLKHLNQEQEEDLDSI